MTLTQRIGLVFLAVIATGCSSTPEQSVEQKRQAILDMRQQVLTTLYAKKPDVKKQINGASGYAVFSNANINLLLASFGGGYGVVKNNQSGAHTYMNMGEVGLGFGLGAKDFRLVFVFHNADSLERFIEQGWVFGAQADAAAKASEKGGALGGEVVADNVTVYQLTETGLALQATVKGTKFWADETLN